LQHCNHEAIQAKDSALEFEQFTENGTKHGFSIEAWKKLDREHGFSIEAWKKHFLSSEMFFFSKNFACNRLHNVRNRLHNTQKTETHSVIDYKLR